VASRLQLLGVVLVGASVLAVRSGSVALIAALACSGIALCLAALWVFGRRVDGAVAGAVSALARKEFTASHAMMSTRGDVLIATDGERIAICELARSGAVLSTRIARPDELRAAVHRSLDEGVFVRVTYRKRDYDLMMKSALRSGDERDRPDDDVAALAEWWVATLHGERPSTDVCVPPLLHIYAHGWPLPEVLPRARAIEPP